MERFTKSKNLQYRCFHSRTMEKKSLGDLKKDKTGVIFSAIHNIYSQLSSAYKSERKRGVKTFLLSIAIR